ncbi:MAG: DegT/DnrJ/EryC1/StrS aminotransferase family protein, partial [Anaerolineaceae bacterium]|nr:DegT/DnrJ/EryC1/StrS aminotransferase family protein [Anaerolineaceae bacterium]
GNAGCFSFFSNKNLATGEGGMVVTDEDSIAAKVRTLRSHGMTTLTWDRHRGHAYTYDVIELGFNYRIDEIHSGLGLAQLKKLSNNNRSRKKITELYREKLKDQAFSGIDVPFLKSPGEPAYHIFPILLPQDINREQFMSVMRQKGIQTSIHYPPIHLFSYYQKRFPGVCLPNTEAAAAREVTLPLYPGMSIDDANFVISAVEETLNEIRLGVMN